MGPSAPATPGLHRRRTASVPSAWETELQMAVEVQGTRTPWEPSGCPQGWGVGTPASLLLLVGDCLRVLREGRSSPPVDTWFQQRVGWAARCFTDLSVPACRAPEPPNLWSQWPDGCLLGALPTPQAWGTRALGVPCWVLQAYLPSWTSDLVASVMWDSWDQRGQGGEGQHATSDVAMLHSGLPWLCLSRTISCGICHHQGPRSVGCGVCSPAASWEV